MWGIDENCMLVDIFDCYVLINILLKDRREKELLRLENCGDGF